MAVICRCLTLAALVLVPSSIRAETVPKPFGDQGRSLEASSVSTKSLQGIWFYQSSSKHTSYLRAKLVLVVRSDRMTVIRSSGAAESVFRIDDERIDIDRYDGSNQLGLVRMHDGELQMTLGDADESRPRHHGHWKGSKQSDGPRHAYYAFQRRPTTEGMKMLSRYLGDELRVGKLIKVTPDEAKLGSLASSKTD